MYGPPGSLRVKPPDAKLTIDNKAVRKLELFPKHFFFSGDYLKGFFIQAAIYIALIYIALYIALASVNHLLMTLKQLPSCATLTVVGWVIAKNGSNGDTLDKSTILTA